MKILVSTNMYPACDLAKVFDVINAFPQEDIGVELFPMFHDDSFEPELKNNLEKFKNVPVSFHGPYYKTEHSKAKGSPEYTRTMEYFNKTLEYAKELNSSYIVFHHNNCVVEDDKTQQIEIARENLEEINTLAQQAKIALVVENAGVISRRNMIFDEQEFINECLAIDNPVLIDIGHSHANGWNLRNVISKLKEKIVAYHLHNNDGYADSHRRLYEGTNDFDSFLEIYKEFTPNADLVVEYDASYAEKTDEVIEDVKALCDFRKKLDS